MTLIITDGAIFCLSSLTVIVLYSYYIIVVQRVSYTQEPDYKIRFLIFTLQEEQHDNIVLYLEYI